ncbi:hypothetical protein [Bradyrhizobium australiense]|nr:hypothetical protein [Bradyrhizobium australiense]
MMADKCLLQGAVAAGFAACDRSEPAAWRIDHRGTNALITAIEI